MFKFQGSRFSLPTGTLRHRTFLPSPLAPWRTGMQLAGLPIFLQSEAPTHITDSAIVTFITEALSGDLLIGARVRANFSLGALNHRLRYWNARHHPGTHRNLLLQTSTRAGNFLCMTRAGLKSNARFLLTTGHCS